MRATVLVCLLISLLFALGCQQEPTTTGETEQVKRVERPLATPPKPPEPPIVEDFEGAPQLSLFPRVGDYQPDASSERHPYWVTFIDHLMKLSGLAASADEHNKAWSFRSVNTIDSLGFFSPLKVSPLTTYEVTFRMQATLPEGASAGIGILEFDEFLWLGEQYTESLYRQHYQNMHQGVRLTGDIEWSEQGFTFTTGPKTAMIHLVLFREGTHDSTVLLFDDIQIHPLSQQGK
ncbi:MAG: hypothetical protein JRE16_08250 [Deltaproteobacteria bacterium]|jgi:hypothetical protein|nr:hypothetical protein [Deltaproteobacteria bacterium]